MPVNEGLVMVRTALPVMLPEAALMVALPGATARARPVLLMAATAGLVLDHVTAAVQSALLLFE